MAGPGGGAFDRGSGGGVQGQSSSFGGGGFSDGNSAVLRVEVDSSRAQDQLNQFNERITNWAAGIASAFAIAAAGAKGLEAVINVGGRVSDVYGALKIDVDQAAAAIDNSASKMTLALQANKLAAAGIEVTADQFRDLTVAAKTHAEATGGEFTDSFDKLTNAVAMGSTRALRQFGIDVEKSGDRTLTAANAINELSNRFRGVTVEAGAADDRIDTLKATWDNATDGFAQGVAEGGALNDLLKNINNLASSLGGVVGAAKLVGDAMQWAWVHSTFVGLTSVLVSHINSIRDALHGTRTEANQTARAIQSTLQTRPTPAGERGGFRMSFAPEDVATNQENLANSNAAVALQAFRDGMISRADAIAQGVDPRQLRSGGGGGRRSQNGMNALDRALRGMDESQQGAEGPDPMMDGEDLSVDSKNPIGNDMSWLTRYAAQGSAHQKMVEKKLRGDRLSITSTKQVTEAEKQAQQQRIQGWSQLTGAMIANTTAAINQGATAGQVGKAILAAFLQQVSQMATVEAIKNTALGLADLAEFNYGSAALHFGAAALWGTVGVGAGVAASAVAPNLDKNAKSAAGGVQPARGGRGSFGSSGGETVQNITVTLNAVGGVIEDSQYRRLGAVVREARRRGYVPAGM